MERDYQLSKMEEALLEATRLGATEKVLELIAGGVNVNVQKEYSRKGKIWITKSNTDQQKATLM
jgi:hypothetical protein